ncbi:putative zinc-type alcohol dehydrogenase-like protein [Providencia alcalifaciens]|nr:putative zinc-type alcohol dehydrogenase-like protein [Providencia alcalifaciens]
MRLIFAKSNKKTTNSLVPFSFERRDLRPDDVEIELLFCGVCHSDVHHVRNDWGGEEYPIIPGHEIIGKITRVGEKVTHFQSGNTVGVGCLIDSCRECSPCKHSHEQFCDNNTLTYSDKDRHDGTATYGGYSEKIVVSERFVLNIPEGLNLTGTAPLLCAGITTYSPLRRWHAGPGKQIAVVGLGGLGHMALKLAAAMGAEVTLISQSPGKEEDARTHGAKNVVISSDAKSMEEVNGKFDLIIDTIPYNHDLNPYVNTLAPQGALVLVGYLGSLDPTLNSAPLVYRGKTVAGSLIGGLKETQEMLDFCGRHGIASDIEMIDIQDINQAYERLLKADVKYRFVIDMQSLTKE